MNVNSYVFKNLVRLAGEFRDDNNTLFDPTVVRLVFEDPAGTKTTYVFGTDAELIKDSVGKYHAVVAAALAGRWKYRWEANQNGEFGEEFVFDMKRSIIS